MQHFCLTINAFFHALIVIIIIAIINNNNYLSYISSIIILSSNFFHSFTLPSCNWIITHMCVCYMDSILLVLSSWHPLHIAYFLVHSLANSLYLSRSVLYIRAISGTSGSSGFGSHNSEQIDSKTLDIVRAGDHWDRRISRQIDPFELMFGW